MLRGALIILAVLALAGAGYIFVLNLPARPVAIDNNHPQPVQPLIQPHETIGLPVRLIIPALGVEANIQTVGLTTDGKMANPQGVNKFRETAWYKDSSRPGQAGSAVIAGHLDNALSLQGVFYHLNELRAGDEIIVKTDQGEQATFKVESSEIYDYQNAPAEKIFNLNDGTARLNLITCDGTWIQSAKSYDKRLVVYTTLISITDTP